MGRYCAVLAAVSLAVPSALSAQPTSGIATDTAPTRIAYGAAYATRARAKGETVDVIVLPGAGHFDVVNPKAAIWPAIRDALTALVQGSR
jgi:acetyl esterase/lipase